MNRFCYLRSLAALASLWLASLPSLSAKPELIRYFPFDEDFSEQIHQGVPSLSGQPTLANGRYGKALQLDGASALHFDRGEDLNLESFTLSAWIRSDSEVPNGSVAGKGSDSYYLWINHGEVKSGFLSDAFYEGHSGIYLKPDTWYFIAVSYDGTHLRMYVNDHLHWLEAVDSGPRPNQGPFAIGHEPQEPPVHWFTGLIDDVRLYDGALATPDIQQLFNAGPR